MATFGKTSDGNTYAVIGQSMLKGTKFACTENGTATKITARLLVITAATNVKFAMFDASKNKVAESDVVNVPTQAATDTDFNLSTTPAVSAQEYYLVGFAAAENQVYIRIAESGTDGAYDATITYPTVPDTLTTAQNYILGTIYCTYTPSASGQQLFTLINMMGY